MLTVGAQPKTGASGVVVDAETGEVLPYVQIYFATMLGGDVVPTTVGTTSDAEGNFSLFTMADYTLLQFQMIGYQTEKLRLYKGQQRYRLVVKLRPDVVGLQDVIVKPQNDKHKYKRKGNPAVELIRNVIANKDSFAVRTQNHYTADIYHRMSFALENFHPNFQKGIWKNFQFAEKYIDTTGVYPSMTVSMRENMGQEYYRRKPRREKTVITRKRHFGLEAVLSTKTLENDMQSVFTDVNINDDNMVLLFNRFVSPLSSTLAASYYQYYIMDTLQVDGEECIDLAFVPVNSESYGFTGHLYIVNDSTYKLKKYKMNVPPQINLNFVSDFSIEHSYRRLENGLWAPDRTNTCAKFYLFNRKRNLLARQTKLYGAFDFDTPLDANVFASATPIDTLPSTDTISIREDLLFWEQHRPEPMSFYESSVQDLVQEFKATPKFNALVMFGDALITEFVPTVPSTRWGESKWDFGPIYNTISWNKLEGVRLRIGGQTTANLHPNLFFTGYVAFGTSDLRPKYEATLLYSFNKKRYHMYEAPRHYLSLSVRYDVEEPGQQLSVVDRDHILMSIPTSKPVLKNDQYIFRVRATYAKEFPCKLTLKANFDFENNEAAGAMSYDRITGYAGNNIALAQRVKSYNNYEGAIELRYSPGAPPVNRKGVESMFTLEWDAPIVSLKHQIGYMDDRNTGGRGYVYNVTSFTAEKRFWFSAFGHLDARLQAGYIWNKTPFTHLYVPSTSTSIFLNKTGFNQMQPMEFLADYYVGLYATYYFKGWILNRIPGINKLKLRGVVSFSGIYGGVTAKNNPYKAGSEGLYKFPDSSVFDINGNYVSGYTSSPLGKMPYMEVTAGFENIFRFIRIDYVRRITYNDYLLPDGIHRRKIGAWGRNGVKLTVRFAL